MLARPGKNWNPHTLQWKHKGVQPLKKRLPFPQEVKCCIELPYDPLILLLGIYPRELKACICGKKPTHSLSSVGFNVFISLSTLVAPSFYYRYPCVGWSILRVRTIYFLVYHCTLGSENQFSSVQLLSHVHLFATPWIAAGQASLSITNSRSLL